MYFKNFGVRAFFLGSSFLFCAPSVHAITTKSVQEAQEKKDKENREAGRQQATQAINIEHVNFLNQIIDALNERVGKIKIQHVSGEEENFPEILNSFLSVFRENLVSDEDASFLKKLLHSTYQSHSEYENLTEEDSLEKHISQGRLLEEVEDHEEDPASKGKERMLQTSPNSSEDKNVDDLF